MEEKKSIYFQRPNPAKPSLVLSSELDSEDESFSDVFKLKKSTKRGQAKSDQPSQVDWKNLKSQLRKVKSPSTSEEKSDSEEGEITDEIYEKILTCPLCARSIRESTNSVKVNHLKQCATKHKVTTRNLLKALKLQIKQDEERDALGLPCVKPEKPIAPRRQPVSTTVKQMTSKDPSIQLAMALSASLQEAQEAAIMEETSNLFAAGLEAEALDRCKTLETIPLCHPKPSGGSKYKKSKCTAVPVLLTRSKEERDCLVSEKVASLVLSQEDTFLPPLPPEPYQIKSKTLRKYAVPNAPAWQINQMESSEDSKHYTATYLQYGSPEKIASCGGKRKKDTFSDQQYSEVEQNILKDLEAMFHSKASKKKPQSRSGTSVSSSSSTLKKEEHQMRGIALPVHEELEMKELKLLSRNLCAMIGKKSLSDLTIYTKEEIGIPCHKIILLSRIPGMLKEIIKEDTEHGKTNEMLMWNMEKKLCHLVLKYVYSGIIDFETITRLEDTQVDELKQFCDTYKIKVLSKVVENNGAKKSDPVVNDETSEHFEHEDSRDSSKPSLTKWLDGLKSRDPSVWRKNFRIRYNRTENKLRLHDAEKEDNIKEQAIADSESYTVESIEPSENIHGESTDTESIQTKCTKSMEHKDENENKNMNETISVVSESCTSGVSDVEKVAEASRQPVGTKSSVYYYDSDIYDQETIGSYKTSDTELISNSDTEARSTLKPVNLDSVYDKNTLSYSPSDDTRNSEVKTTPVKKNTLSQQTVSGSPELFSGSDADEDNDRNILVVPNNKSNTQSNLYKLINMMEKDIEPTCPAEDTKKRKRGSVSPIDNLKRSKRIPSSNSSAASAPDIHDKVNKTVELNVNKDIPSATNVLKTTNPSIPCVAGEARKRTIDFDKIEVDTSVPPRINQTLDLTVENLLMFDEINEASHETNGSFFGKETLPVRPVDDNASSHGSSLFFKSLNNRKKKTDTKEKSNPIQDTRCQTNTGEELGIKRRKVRTPDFLKAKFSQEIIEIKSSSSEISDSYPTKALSQTYQFSQRVKKHTPPKRRSYKCLSQPKGKSSTKSPKFYSQKIMKTPKLFDTDSSDELAMIAKRKIELSPIPKVNTSSTQLRGIQTNSGEISSPGKGSALSPIPNRSKNDTHINDSSPVFVARSDVTPIKPNIPESKPRHSKSFSSDECSSPSTYSNVCRVKKYSSNNERTPTRKNSDSSINERIRTRKDSDSSTNERIRTRKDSDSSTNERIRTRKDSDSSTNERIRIRKDSDSSTNEKIRTRKNSDSSTNERIRTRKDSDSSTNERIRTRKDSDSSTNERIRTRKDSDSSTNERIRTRKNSDGSTNERKTSREKKMAKSSTRYSQSTCSPEETDVVLAKRKPYHETKKQSTLHPSCSEEIFSSSSRGSPPRKVWEHPQPAPSDNSPECTPPLKDRNDPSPQFFSPPMYVWDDPNYEDNIIPPALPLESSASHIEHKDEVKEKISTTQELGQVNLSQALKHGLDLPKDNAEPKATKGSFQDLLTSLSQSLYNSQFMNISRQFLKNNSDEQLVEPVLQRSVLEKPSTPEQNSSRTITSVGAKHNLHISPYVIINQPAGASDDSSCDSVWGKRSKLYQQCKPKSQYVDTEDKNISKDNTTSVPSSRARTSTISRESSQDTEGMSGAELNQKILDQNPTLQSSWTMQNNPSTSKNYAENSSSDSERYTSATCSEWRKTKSMSASSHVTHTSHLTSSNTHDSEDTSSRNQDDINPCFKRVRGKGNISHDKRKETSKNTSTALSDANTVPKSSTLHTYTKTSFKDDTGSDSGSSYCSDDSRVRDGTNDKVLSRVPNLQTYKKTSSKDNTGSDSGSSYCSDDSRVHHGTNDKVLSRVPNLQTYKKTSSKDNTGSDSGSSYCSDDSRVRHGTDDKVLSRVPNLQTYKKTSSKDNTGSDSGSSYCSDDSRVHHGTNDKVLSRVPNIQTYKKTSSKDNTGSDTGSSYCRGYITGQIPGTPGTKAKTFGVLKTGDKKYDSFSSETEADSEPVSKAKPAKCIAKQFSSSHPAFSTNQTIPDRYRATGQTTFESRKPHVKEKSTDKSMPGSQRSRSHLSTKRADVRTSGTLREASTSQHSSMTRSSHLSTKHVQPSTNYSHLSTAYSQPSTKNILQPSTSYSQPSTSYCQPSTSYSRASTKHIQPSTSYSQPSTKHIQPSTSYSQPSTSYCQPSTSYSRASTKHIQPSTSYSQPSTKHIQPFTSYSQPSTKHIQPSTSYSQPSTKHIQPFTSYSQPSTKHIQPSTSYSQPSTNYCQPSTSYIQPSTNYCQPSTSYSQPSTNYCQPSTSYSQPSTNYCQPSTSYSRSSTKRILPSSKHSSPSTINTNLTLSRSQTGFRDSPSSSQPRSSFSDLVKSSDPVPRARKSLNFDHLLDESLHVNESYLGRLEAQHGGGSVARTPSRGSGLFDGRPESQHGAVTEARTSSRGSDGISTPGTVSRKSRAMDTSVTPLADYSRMETPLLKKELNKYGLKPSLGKAKAKLLLRYIYNQTHPYVESEEDSSRHPVEKPPSKKRKTNLEPKTIAKAATGSNRIVAPSLKTKAGATSTSSRSVKRKESGNPGPSSTRRGEGTPVSSSDEECISRDEEGSASDVSLLSDTPHVYEESILFENTISRPEEEAVSATPASSQAPQFLLEVERILKSTENYAKILQYEPIWLEHLHAELKGRGVRSNLKQLMDYLDEKCITFRTVRQKPRIKKTTQSKKRKPTAPQSQVLGRATLPSSSQPLYSSQPVTSSRRNL